MNTYTRVGMTLLLLMVVFGAYYIYTREQTVLPTEVVEVARESETEKVDIGDNDLTEAVTVLNTETLDLHNQGLSSVPVAVFGDAKIETLDLSGNDLSGSLPAEIRLLQNLVSLDLSDNNFTGVPAEIGQLTNLEILDLSNNPITGLPYELVNLKRLKVLDLQNTEYSEQDLAIIKQGLSVDVVIKL